MSKNLSRVMRGFLNADFGFKRLLLEVTFLLAIGRFSILFLPFKKIARWMGNPGEETPKKDIDDNSRRFLNRLMTAIDTVSKYTPWKSNCFAQALCAHWILKRKRQEHTIYFGLKRKTKGPLKAHAWLRSARYIITGGSGKEGFTIVNTFAYLVPE